ncbi:cbb3-type cytochrome oxidase assembly protein CcoS [Bradyrhizobium sp. AUGA SZCCT0431]|nr:cbb3-type cytochrome oxidase assembly protein CcoS [Bradyrhizobium sp. AUGA SZCCT0431]
MNGYFYLIPIALGLGITALAAFMWSLKNGQYDDLEGAAERILHEETDAPIQTPRGNVNSPRPFPGQDSGTLLDRGAEFAKSLDGTFRT